MKKLQVLYVDDLDGIIRFLTVVIIKKRFDLTVFTVSNEDELFKIATKQKDIKIVIITKTICKKRTIGNLRCFLKSDPEFLGLSSSPPVIERLKNIGCDIVFDNREDLIRHIHQRHLVAVR